LLPQLAYNLENIKTFAENAMPAKLGKFIEEKTADGFDLRDAAMRDLAAEIKAITTEKADNIAENTKISEFVRRMTGADASLDIVTWLDKHQVPLTMNNILAAKNMTKDPFFISNRLEELSTQENSDFAGVEALTLPSASDLAAGFSSETLRNLMNALSEQLESIKQNATERKKIEQINVLQNAIQFQAYITAKTGGQRAYIPLKMHDKIFGLNLYVMNNHLDSGQTTTAFMSLETKNLGHVQIYLNTDAKSNDIKIHSDEAVAANFLENDGEALIQALSGHGKTNISFGKAEQNTVFSFA
jgi:hypothetical protein